MTQAADFPEQLVLPATLQCAFPGFDQAAFHVLTKLRSNPSVARYQELKEEIDAAVVRPFRLYRDDLVVNWVLPSGLLMETERNVFSRFPKNDFGAGAANSHQWLSFYRLGAARLTDLQLIHSISPDSFVVGLYLSRRMKQPWSALQSLIMVRRQDVLVAIRQILSGGDFSLEVTTGGRSPAETVGSGSLESCFDRPLDSLWLANTAPAARVVAEGSSLVERSIGLIEKLWHLYYMIVTVVTR